MVQTSEKKTLTTVFTRLSMTVEGAMNTVTPDF